MGQLLAQVGHFAEQEAMILGIKPDLVLGRGQLARVRAGQEVILDGVGQLHGDLARVDGRAEEAGEPALDQPFQSILKPGDASLVHAPDYSLRCGARQSPVAR